ncbi:MAG: hypothetical protein NZ874_01030 [Fimbriimonadales bacterium]|nr:hypothetical protein [Fimbriimonadales bacterium]
MAESVRLSERVAMVPPVRGRSPQEEREQEMRRRRRAREAPPKSPEPASDAEPHTLDVEV